ncbi:MAG: nucleotidyl transferase AbiEii/AbiGii toxin family protein [Anaerolineales bacterium]|nr:nucleotidyl transferase AbiEii/AbiGii toxin family protein [Anaerolineales bacterium]
MTLPDDLASLIEPLKDLQNLLDRYDERGVIIGGIAIGFLGKPRLTVDLDAMFLASFADIPRILELAQAEGIEPREKDVANFAKRSRVLLMRHKKSGINIDISLGILPFEIEVVERSVKHDAGAVRVRLPTPEDLIIMKAIARRPKDLVDIGEIQANNPNLDLARIKYWVEEFAKVLESPELWGEIEAILKESQS